MKERYHEYVELFQQIVKLFSYEPHTVQGPINKRAFVPEYH